LSRNWQAAFQQGDSLPESWVSNMQSLESDLALAPAASGDSSGVTDSANLQSAINATRTGGTLVIPAGTYTLKTGLTVPKVMSIRGGTASYGSASPAGVQIVAASGASAGANNALISIAPGSLQHSFSMENVSVDLSNATSLVGVYVTNVDNSFLQNVFVRDGAAGIQLDGVQLFTLRDCVCFNQRTRGYYSSSSSNVDIRFYNCIYEQTVGATWGATSAWDISAGASFIMHGCEGLRSPSGSSNWLNYAVNVTSAAATTWIFMVNSWFDAVSDGTGANSANSTDLNLTSTVVNVRATNCFFSASSSSGQRQRAVRINGGSDHQFVNCTFGGSGVEFATGNATRCGFANCNFVQQFSDPALSFTGGAAPTVLSFRGNTLQSPSSGIVGSAADAVTFAAATGGWNAGS
jgi:hypothetical protein